MWLKQLTGGPASGGSPFDEAIEHHWGNVWLFYASSIRFTAAMAGDGDYAMFADGHYSHLKRIKELQEWLEEREVP
jgi:hypothetical protein